MQNISWEKKGTNKAIQTEKFDGVAGSQVFRGGKQRSQTLQSGVRRSLYAWFAGLPLRDKHVLGDECNAAGWGGEASAKEDVVLLDDPFAPQAENVFFPRLRVVLVDIAVVVSSEIGNQ